MDNKKKSEIMNSLDKAMGKNSVNDINEIFEDIIANIDDYDKRFLEVMLGYTGVFNRDVSNWKVLYNATSLLEQTKD